MSDSPQIRVTFTEGERVRIDRLRGALRLAQWVRRELCRVLDMPMSGLELPTPRVDGARPTERVTVRLPEAYMNKLRSAASGSRDLGPTARDLILRSMG